MISKLIRFWPLISYRIYRAWTRGLYRLGPKTNNLNWNRDISSPNFWKWNQTLLTSLRRKCVYFFISKSYFVMTIAGADMFIYKNIINILITSSWLTYHSRVAKRKRGGVRGSWSRFTYLFLKNSRVKCNLNNISGVTNSKSKT